MCIRDRFYTNIELMNILVSWLKMCKKQGNYSETQIEEEIKRICNIPEIKDAAMQLCERENKNAIAVMVHNGEIKQIHDKLMKQISVSYTHLTNEPVHKECFLIYKIEDVVIKNSLFSSYKNEKRQ